MSLGEREIQDIADGMSKTELERVFRISILDQVKSLRTSLDDLARRVDSVGSKLGDIRAGELRDELKSVKDSLISLEKSVSSYNVPGVVDEVRGLSDKIQKIHEKVLVINMDDLRIQIKNLEKDLRRREVLISDERIKSSLEDLETLTRFKVQFLAIIGVLLSLASWLWNIYSKIH